MRRLLLIVGILAVLVVGAGLALPYLVNADQFRPMLKAELEKSLRRPVELGKLSLTVFPLAITASDVVIGEDPAFGKERPFAKAESLAVKIDLFSLLRSEVHVDSLRIAKPLVELIRDANGKWNVDSLSSKDDTSSPLKLAELRIDGGRVALTTPSHPRAEYHHIDVLLRDYGGSGKSPLSVTANLPGADGGSINFDGTVAGGNLEGEIQLKDCSVAALERAAGRAKSQFDGQLSGQAKVASAGKDWSAGGQLDLRSKTLGNTTATFQAEAKGDLTRIERFDAKVGQLNLKANGTIDHDRLAIKVNAADAPITELAKLAAGFGVAFAPGMDVQGTLGADLTVSGTTAAPTFNGQVRTRNVKVQGGDLKQPVESPGVVVDFTPEQLRTSPFEVRTGNTKLSGSLSLTKYASPAPQLEAAITIPPSNLSDLIDIAQAYGVEAARGVKATGTAAVEARVTGSLGKSGKLQYRGTGSVSGANLQSPQLTKPVAVRQAKLRFEGEAAGVEGLDATVGQTTLTGRLATRGDRLDFALAADKIDVDELRTLLVESKDAPAKSQKPSTLAGRGTITIGTLKMDRLVLTNVRSTLALEGGQWRFDPLTANVYGGTHTGTILVDQRSAQPVYTLDSKLERIDSGQLLEAVSSLKQLIGGPLSANAKITVSPKPGEDLMKSLDGTLGLKFAEGKIYSMNLLGELGAVAKFLKMSPEKYTSFLALTGDLTLNHGVANTQNMKLDLNNATVTMSGLMNLVDQSLNLKLRTLLNPKLAEEVGGTKIGGFLTAAVGGPNGDMTIPSLVTGTFAKPRFAPDAAAVAQLKMQSVVPGITKDPKSVVDAIKSPDGVKGIIDIFKGKKKQP